MKIDAAKTDRSDGSQRALACLAGQVRDSLLRDRDTVRAYNKLKPAWVPPRQMRNNFLVSQFIFTARDKENEPREGKHGGRVAKRDTADNVYIDRRDVPRSKYMPHIGDKQMRKARAAQ